MHNLVQLKAPAKNNKKKNILQMKKQRILKLGGVRDEKKTYFSLLLQDILGVEGAPGKVLALQAGIEMSVSSK